MNEELIKKLIEYLEKTETFVYEQAPDLAQQILSYKLIESGIEGFVCAIICIIAVTIAFNTYSNPSYDKYDMISTAAFIKGFVSALVSVITFLISVESFCRMIKITYAPKLFLLEYLVKISKG